MDSEHHCYHLLVPAPFSWKFSVNLPIVCLLSVRLFFPSGMWGGLNENTVVTRW